MRGTNSVQLCYGDGHVILPPRVRSTGRVWRIAVRGAAKPQNTSIQVGEARHIHTTAC